MSCIEHTVRRKLIRSLSIGGPLGGIATSVPELLKRGIVVLFDKVLL